jgi:hypothetical protein
MIRGDHLQGNKILLPASLFAPYLLVCYGSHADLYLRSFAIGTARTIAFWADLDLYRSSGKSALALEPLCQSSPKLKGVSFLHIATHRLFFVSLAAEVAVSMQIQRPVCRIGQEWRGLPAASRLGGWAAMRRSC